MDCMHRSCCAVGTTAIAPNGPAVASRLSRPDSSLGAAFPYERNLQIQRTHRGSSRKCSLRDIRRDMARSIEAVYKSPHEPARHRAGADQPQPQRLRLTLILTANP